MLIPYIFAFCILIFYLLLLCHFALLFLHFSFQGDLFRAWKFEFRIWSRDFFLSQTIMSPLSQRPALAAVTRYSRFLL